MWKSGELFSFSNNGIISINFSVPAQKAANQNNMGTAKPNVSDVFCLESLFKLK